MMIKNKMDVLVPLNNDWRDALLEPEHTSGGKRELVPLLVCRSGGLTNRWEEGAGLFDLLRILCRRIEQ